MPLTTEEKNERELTLFAIFLECTCQQIGMLDGRWQRRPKQLINDLSKSGKRVMNEMRSGMSPEAIYAIEEMHDHFHLVMRLSSQVPAADSADFIEHVRAYVKKYEQPKHILDA